MVRCWPTSQAQYETRPQFHNFGVGLGCNVTDKQTKEWRSGGGTLLIRDPSLGGHRGRRNRGHALCSLTHWLQPHTHSQDTKPSQWHLANTLMRGAWLPALLAAVKSWMRRLTGTRRAMTLSHHPWLHPLTVAKTAAVPEWLRGERSRSVNPMVKQTLKGQFTQKWSFTYSSLSVSSGDIFLILRQDCWKQWYRPMEGLLQILWCRLCIQKTRQSKLASNSDLHTVVAVETKCSVLDRLVLVRCGKSGQIHKCEHKTLC